MIAPAICGETLNRPGSFISTSVSRSSISTSETSPSAPPPLLQPVSPEAADGSALPGRFGHLQPLGDGFERSGVADEYPQTLLGLCRGGIQRLGVKHPRSDVLALQFGA